MKSKRIALKYIRGFRIDNSYLTDISYKLRNKMMYRISNDSIMLTQIRYPIMNVLLEWCNEE